MKKWKQILGVALLIILGGLAGSIVTRAYFMKWHLVMRVSPQARTDFLMEKFSKELNLNDDQEMKIEAVIKQLEEDYQKKKRQHIERLMEEIKANLDDGQQKKLEILRKKFEKGRKRLEEEYLRQR